MAVVVAVVVGVCRLPVASLLAIVVVVVMVFDRYLGCFGEDGTFLVMIVVMICGYC